MGHFRAFLVTLLALDAVVFVVGSFLLPPDPFTQLLMVGPALLLAPAVAWWLVYRDGFARVQGLIEPDE
ncbi:hypothetical protein E6P09_05060 [Haloferax mediterranei ATCC 33500]|uniref:Uncharacterized protein n=1 Tax=Haloferax mediterranei (strain ATCC 33500 / DSM 1411 / JCM 8866 / NBRC 14739 / NCIMB 2177 / R-4) TaxID=523841 RepID=I3R1M4_HALMT|nr:hypothetical protein [Haloferax mediterranei]AFK18134.1 hypothetical protein HFX_0398 [Haloferax mediterranei ATCC 33500]AHZ22459.1 hypothetical protein BM92_07275 [Haloferax mediterranei ATCC 33500]EMA02593.1 hypothetical protein C439_08420 [Haloferax mediterranei ATCC 33500]MDX5988224.1 hypothetical protein [Haloferax mediterranei ATCC 33500]QCQ74666.1 hypothetical protein E6P09_05060 [Haloferax mediterranei ATCC 33500]